MFCIPHLLGVLFAWSYQNVAEKKCPWWRYSLHAIYKRARWTYLSLHCGHAYGLVVVKRSVRVLHVVTEACQAHVVTQLQSHHHRASPQCGHDWLQHNTCSLWPAVASAQWIQNVSTQIYVHANRSDMRIGFKNTTANPPKLKKKNIHAFCDALNKSSVFFFLYMKSCQEN